jgi:hypothetical protein
MQRGRERGRDGGFLASPRPASAVPSVDACARLGLEAEREPGGVDQAGAISRSPRKPCASSVTSFLSLTASACRTRANSLIDFGHQGRGDAVAPRRRCVSICAAQRRPSLAAPMIDELPFRLWATDGHAAPSAAAPLEGPDACARLLMKRSISGA